MTHRQRQPQDTSAALDNPYDRMLKRRRALADNLNDAIVYVLIPA